jgi:hypothetical protein
VDYAEGGLVCPAQDGTGTIPVRINLEREQIIPTQAVRGYCRALLDSINQEGSLTVETPSISMAPARGMTTVLTTAGALGARDIGAISSFYSVSGAYVTGKINSLIREDESTTVYLDDRGLFFTVPDDTHVTLNRPVRRNRG